MRRGQVTRLAEVLAGVPGYDAVIIDTPPRLAFALPLALHAARWAILPTLFAQQDLDTLVDTLNLLDDTRLGALPSAEQLAIVPNPVHRNSVDLTGVRLLRESFGTLVTEPVPHAVAIQRASNQGRPLAQCDPRCGAARAYRSLAERVRRAFAEGRGGHVSQ